MARTFNGTTENIRTTIGGLSGFAFGTFIAVVKRNSTGWNAACILHSTGAVARSGMEIADNTTGNFVTWQFPTGGTFGQSNFTVVNADGWVLIGSSKATGTVSPRFHKYVYTSDTWTHDNGTGATGADNTTPASTGEVRIGEWQTTDFFGGDIAAVAVWLRQLSDAEVENLAFSFVNWHAAAPDAMWILDQAATGTTLLDLTGGHADQSGITGTTVSTNSVPILGYGHDVEALSSSAAVVAGQSYPAVITVTGTRSGLAGSAVIQQSVAVSRDMQPNSLVVTPTGRRPTLSGNITVVGSVAVSRDMQPNSLIVAPTGKQPTLKGDVTVIGSVAVSRDSQPVPMTVSAGRQPISGSAQSYASVSLPPQDSLPDPTVVSAVRLPIRGSSLSGGSWSDSLNAQPVPVVLTGVRLRVPGSVLLLASRSDSLDAQPVSVVVGGVRLPVLGNVVLGGSRSDSLDMQPVSVVVAASKLLVPGSAAALGSRADVAAADTPPHALINVVSRVGAAGLTVVQGSQDRSLDAQPNSVLSTPELHPIAVGSAVILGSQADPVNTDTPPRLVSSVGPRPAPSGSSLVLGSQDRSLGAQPDSTVVMASVATRFGYALVLRPLVEDVAPPPQSAVRASGVSRSAASPAVVVVGSIAEPVALPSSLIVVSAVTNALHVGSASATQSMGEPPVLPSGAVISSARPFARLAGQLSVVTTPPFVVPPSSPTRSVIVPGIIPHVLLGSFWKLSSRPFGLPVARRIVVGTSRVYSKWLTGVAGPGWRTSDLVDKWSIGDLAQTWVVSQFDIKWSMRGLDVASQSSTSLEYLRVTVSAQVNGVVINPTSDTVQMAFLTSSSVAPGVSDWKAASWNTVGNQYQIQCLVGPGGAVQLTPGNYYVWIQITDNPEIIVRDIDILKITT